MKKVLTLLAIMAIAMGVVFAESSVSDLSATANGTAELEVTLTLDANTDSYYEFGFSSNEVTLTDAGDVSDVTPLETLALTKVDGGDYSNAKTPAYVYWISKNLSGSEIKVSMSMNDQLTGTTNVDSKIDWSATANSKTATTLTPGSKSVELETIAASGDLTVVSYPLTVTTENLLTTDGIVADTYKSTLSLTITTTN